MTLFLDTSVLLAAAGSSRGSSRAIFDSATACGWDLLSSPYAINEVLRNLRKVSPQATGQWVRLRPQLTLVDDVLAMDRPVVFPASKDRPILFTALAWADVLLTLDKQISPMCSAEPSTAFMCCSPMTFSNGNDLLDANVLRVRPIR